MDAAKNLPALPALKLLSSGPAAPEMAPCPLCEARACDSEDCPCGGTWEMTAVEAAFYVDCSDCGGERTMGAGSCSTCRGLGVCHEDDAWTASAWRSERRVMGGF